MATRGPKEEGHKRKRVTLKVSQKLQLIEKLEQGVSVANICEMYGIKKQTVSDIRKAKAKLEQFSLKCTDSATTSTSTDGNGKRVKLAHTKNLDVAVYNWYLQQVNDGVHVCTADDLKSAYVTLGKSLGLEVEPSDEWVSQFGKKHGIDTDIFGQSISEDASHNQSLRAYINEFDCNENDEDDPKYLKEESFKDLDVKAGEVDGNEKQQVTPALSETQYRKGLVITDESKFLTASSSQVYNAETYGVNYVLLENGLMKEEQQLTPVQPTLSETMFEKRHGNGYKATVGEFLGGNASQVYNAEDYGEVYYVIPEKEDCIPIYQEEEIILKVVNGKEEITQPTLPRVQPTLSETMYKNRYMTGYKNTSGQCLTANTSQVHMADDYGECNSVVPENAKPTKVLNGKEKEETRPALSETKYQNTYIIVNKETCGKSTSATTSQVYNADENEGSDCAVPENDESIPNYQEEVIMFEVVRDDAEEEEEEIMIKILPGNSVQEDESDSEYQEEEMVVKELNEDDEHVIQREPTFSDIKSLMDIAIHFIGTSSDPDIASFYEHFQQFRGIIIKKHQDAKLFKPNNSMNKCLLPVSSSTTSQPSSAESLAYPNVQVSEESENDESNSDLYLIIE